MGFLSKVLKVPRHFTLPYRPLNNKAIERPDKELLRTFGAILSDCWMKFDEWLGTLPIAQSILKNAPSPQRKNLALITAFIGKNISTPICTFLRTLTT